MEEGLKKLYTGDFNSLTEEKQPDGSVIVTLSRRGEGKRYRFRVKNLYQENEEVLEHEVLDTACPKFIQDRMKEAKRRTK